MDSIFNYYSALGGAHFCGFGFRISSKGYNGTECVLKTLCEVRQKQDETQPGAFLVEIVRAIFR